MVFEHIGGRDFDLPRPNLTTQGLSLWSLNIVPDRRFNCSNATKWF